MDDPFLQYLAPEAFTLLLEDEAGTRLVFFSLAFYLLDVQFYFLISYSILAPTLSQRQQYLQSLLKVHKLQLTSVMYVSFVIAFVSHQLARRIK
jgi:hypothetical protein